MIRLGFLLVSVGLLGVGGEGVYHAARNRQQRLTTCERFVSERPAIAWVRLTDCDVDYIGAGYRESGGRIVELLFPVRPAGQSRNVPAVAIVATQDPKALDIAQRTIGTGRQADQEAFLVMMLTIVTELKASREVEGYARVRLVDTLAARRVVSGLAGPVDGSPVVIDLHERPRILVPVLEAVAGVVALLLFVFLQTRRRRVNAAAPTRGAALAPGSLRGLMLLNLPPAAGAEAVEHAPPLGIRADVIGTLQAALPGIRIDESGRGTFEQPDCTIEISLGPEAPIATAVLEARGDGAIEVMRTIVRETGWRVFAPRRGTFIESEIVEGTKTPA